MACTNPPALSDDDLSAAIDRQAPVAVTDHLAVCSHCAARLAQARATEHALTVALARWDCPSARLVAEAELNLLVTTAERERARRHLEECAACAAEAADLRAFVASVDAADADLPIAPVEPAHDQAVTGVSRTLPGVIAEIMPRAAVALRGAAAGPVVATVAGATIVVEHDADASGRVVIHGQVAADDQAGWTGALVEVRQTDGTRSMTTLDEVGGFRFGPVAAGTADLRIIPEHGESVVVNGLTFEA